jgi:hypothetical protein
LGRQGGDIRRSQGGNRNINRIIFPLPRGKGCAGGKKEQKKDRRPAVDCFHNANYWDFPGRGKEGPQSGAEKGARKKTDKKKEWYPDGPFLLCSQMHKLTGPPFGGSIFGTAFPGLLHKFPLNRLLLPVQDGRGFFVVFPLLEFPDDTFLFHHALKAFDGLLQHLVVVNHDMGQK